MRLLRARRWIAIGLVKLAITANVVVKSEIRFGLPKNGHAPITGVGCAPLFAIKSADAALIGIFEGLARKAGWRLNGKPNP